MLARTASVAARPTAFHRPLLETALTAVLREPFARGRQPAMLDGKSKQPYREVGLAQPHNRRRGLTRIRPAGATASCASASAAWRRWPRCAAPFLSVLAAAGPSLPTQGSSRRCPRRGCRRGRRCGGTREVNNASVFPVAAVYPRDGSPVPIWETVRMHAHALHPQGKCLTPLVR